MAEPLQLRILVSDRTAFEHVLAGPLELGRRQAGEPEAYSIVPAAGSSPARLVVARQDERDNVSRRHALLEPLPGGRVRVTNHSKVALRCGAASGGSIPAGASVDLASPLSFSFPGRMVTIGPRDSGEHDGLQSLDERTIGPGHRSDLSVRLRSLPALTGPQHDEMVGWLQSTMGVLQATVGASDFMNKATEALVQILGLDDGRVLLLKNDEWVVVEEGHPREGTSPWRPSTRVLAQMKDKKKTFWQLARRNVDADTPSLDGLQNVVAAPILDAEGNVIGALYGERRKAGSSPLQGSGKLEAMLVELLACGVATGLARQTQERAALEAGVRFEQFFGPDLARRLAREPNLLEGRNADVTMLFCDVRGFSRFSEKLGPAETVRWINDLMTALSERVLDEKGVLVDYIGDELVAMWGAPEDQPDQAARAVRAGLAMVGALPALNERWLGVLAGPISVGIGINTGTAQVGNTGSKFKFKYGPLGTTVNLASRVQGLTRYLKCRLLVTRATREQLGAEFIARRIVNTRVVNIEEPVDLFEVELADGALRKEFFAESEAALDALESGDFALAARKSGALMLDHRTDGPLLLILSRATNALMLEGKGFDIAWEPPGK